MLFSKLAADLKAIKYRDPAFGSYITAPFVYPSFQGLLFFRIANPLWRLGLRFPARFLMQLARWLTGIEIHQRAFYRSWHGCCDWRDSRNWP